MLRMKRRPIQQSFWFLQNNMEINRRFVRNHVRHRRARQKLPKFLDYIDPPRRESQNDRFGRRIAHGAQRCFISAVWDMTAERTIVIFLNIGSPSRVTATRTTISYGHKHSRGKIFHHETSVPIEAKPYNSEAFRWLAVAVVRPKSITN